ncbi:MAG: hypothetical protein KJ064_21355 [Anaerolineae bacterium]|nr:hypothetical protein [Anaerolineae bacterium]
MEQAENNDISIYRPSQQNGALRQGEVLSDVSQVILALNTIDDDVRNFDVLSHPYAMVVSQDCDLDWDFKARYLKTERGVSSNKLMPNVLLCMITTARNLRDRDKDLHESREITSDVWKQIKNNKHERYHFLQAIAKDEDGIGEGLPELGVDFKRYFTLPTEEIYFRIQRKEIKRRCVLKSPYVEHFSSRFYYFQSRIALPQDHYSETESQPTKKGD